MDLCDDARTRKPLRSHEDSPLNPGLSVFSLRLVLLVTIAALIVATVGCRLTEQQQAQLVAVVSTERVSVETMIRTRWAGTGQADCAVRIAHRESRLNPRAKNRRSSASGVFQLTAVHWRGRFDPFDAQANIDYAFKLWKGSGWRPWLGCRHR